MPSAGQPRPAARCSGAVRTLFAAADCTHPAETDSCAWALRCAKSAKNPGKPFVTAHAHTSLRRCARHRHLPSRVFAAQAGGEKQSVGGFVSRAADLSRYLRNAIVQTEALGRLKHVR